MSVTKAAAVPISDMKAPKKGKAGLIVLLVTILLILGFIALTAFNVFGLRDNMLFPLLRNVPVINNIIPEPVYTDGADIAATLAELEARTYTLTTENALLEEQLENLNQTIEQLQRDNTRLAEYEMAFEQFAIERETLYRNLAMENPEAFMIFFNTMDPALVEELFLDIIYAEIEWAEWQNYMASWINMSPVQVARVIESMLTTDMRLIVDVMLELPEPFRGDILNSLAPDSAAAVLRQMEP